MKTDYKQVPGTPNQKEKPAMTEQKKAHWTEIGAAWQYKDGKGFAVILKLMPLDGRIVIRENNKESA